MSDKELLTEEEVFVIIEGTLKSIISNRDYFYHSAVGPSYSKLYPDGERFLIKSMQTLLPLLSKAQEEALDVRAKDLVVKNLKN